LNEAPRSENPDLGHPHPAGYGYLHFPEQNRYSSATIPGVTQFPKEEPMEKVTITCKTLDQTGKVDNGKVDLEFAMDENATKPNDVLKFKFILKPMQPAPSTSLEFCIGWQDAANCDGILQQILASNPPT
jgi:hypothetical protein